jgi:3-deoxy-D-manno-octulosonic-acid transferase
MRYLIYNVLLILAAPVILFILFAKKRCRRGLAERFGGGGPARESSVGPGIWIHAVSLGEVTAAVPFVQALHARYPAHRIVVSTVTETGREAVEQRLGGIATPCYAPLDFPWAVARAIERIRPSAFLFVETELWPNLLRALSRRGIPAVLINGRLSSRSYRRYRWLRWFFAGVLDHVTLALVQSDRDVTRFVSLGAPPHRVIRTGNLKFDQLQQGSAQVTAPDRRTLGLTDHERLIIAGSTHPGEEEELLDCYRLLLETHPSLVLLLAPRHVERADALEATVKKHGLAAIRRSRLSDPYGEITGPRVIILDTRGELSAVYRHAVLAFVGGTLVPVGGHNVLEPALWGRPVLFGPYTDHCAELAELLLQAGGAIRVADGRELAVEAGRLLKDRSGLDTAGSAARRVVLENRGAVQRTLDLLDSVLSEPTDVRGRPALHRMPQEMVR